MSDAERLRRALRSRAQRAPRDPAEEAERQRRNAEAAARSASPEPPPASAPASATAALVRAADEGSQLALSRLDTTLPLRLHGDEDSDLDGDEEAAAIAGEVLETTVAPDPFEDHPLARAEALAPMVHGGPRAFGLSRLPASFHVLSGAEKLEWVLALPDPRASVQALPAEELVFLLDAIGHADAGELLALASARQLQAAVDLDVWRGDRLDRRAFAHLMAVAVAAGSDVVDRLLAAQEDGVLTAFIGRSAMIYEGFEEAEQCAPEDWEVFSAPDSQLYIAVDADDTALGPIRVMVESLFRMSVERGRRVLRAVRWELPESLEEDLYDHRGRRLADLGFLPREDAREVYGYQDPDVSRARLEDQLAGVSAPQGGTLRPYRADAAPDGSVADAAEAPEAPTRTDLALSGVPEPGFLREAAALLPMAEQERLQTGLVFLAYRIQAALAERFDDTERLGEHARHALTTASLGLSYLARGRAEVGAAILQIAPIDVAFTAGHSLVVRLHLRAVALRRRLGGPDRAALLDGRDGAIVRALLRPLPLWPMVESELVASATGQTDGERLAAAAAAAPSPLPDEPDERYDATPGAEDEEHDAQHSASAAGLRPYEREEELVAGATALHAIGAQLTLLEAASDADLPAALAALDAALGDRAADITLSALLATAVAWAVLDGQPRLHPLDPDALGRLLREAMTGSDGSRKIRPDLRAALSRALLLLPDLDDDGAAALDAAVSAALDALDHELGGLDPSRPVDTRFVGTALLVTDRHIPK
ncbi:MAG: hypothetical protein RIT45_993 [Pseudomonadota bacterium]